MTALKVKEECGKRNGSDLQNWNIPFCRLHELHHRKSDPDFLTPISRAYNEGYLPVVMIMSNQINSMVSRRYTNGQILVLSGQMNDNETECTYAFFKKVVGFDLAAFLVENKQIIQKEIKDILKNLVRP